MKVSGCNLFKPASCKDNINIVQLAKKLKNEISKHLIIVDRQNRPVGIISSVDIVNKVVAMGKNPKKLKARDIMTKEIFSVDENDDVSKAYYGLIERNIYFCPVTKRGKLKGILSLQEITKRISFPQR